MKIKILLLLVVILVCLCPLKEGLFIEDWQSVSDTTNTGLVNDHYDKLMDNFMTIFPSRNRNAGGPQFYHHIYEHRDTLTKDKFMLYNTFYCGVSGSPIDPKRGKVYDYVKLDHVDGRQIVGKYYRCCWPCLCDIMKYAKVEEHVVTLKDGDHSHMVVTIQDPCANQQKFPDSVSSFTCSDSVTENGIRTDSGRLIIAVLHEHEEYDSDKHDSLINPVLDQCQDRMNTEPDDLRGGMGDIFVKLAIIND